MVRAARAADRGLHPPHRADGAGGADGDCLHALHRRRRGQGQPRRRPRRRPRRGRPAGPPPPLLLYGPEAGQQAVLALDCAGWLLARQPR